MAVNQLLDKAGRTDMFKRLAVELNEAYEVALANHMMGKPVPQPINPPKRSKQEAEEAAFYNARNGW